MVTIQSKTRKALYSTPPSSSICSAVRPSNRLFRPTTAAKVMYGTSLSTGPSRPSGARAPLPPMVFVRGMVSVRVTDLVALGKNRLNRDFASERGVGKPPKSLRRGSGRDCIVDAGRREYVRGKEDVVAVRGSLPTRHYQRQATQKVLSESPSTAVLEEIVRAAMSLAVVIGRNSWSLPLSPSSKAIVLERGKASGASAFGHPAC